MKKLYLLLFVICNFLFVTYCSAQAPSIQWQKSLGGSNIEVGQAVNLTNDGGYIIAGYTMSNDGDVTGNHGDNDLWIVKLNSSGNIAWQKTYGGSGDDRANAIRQTPDGGYITAGSTYSFDGDVNGMHGSIAIDFWVIKTDSVGNLQWQKCLGGSDYDEGWSVDLTSDGNYIVSGISNSIDGDVSGGHGNSDAWIVKLDTAGNILWQKCLGGSNEEYAGSIQQTTDGGYIIVAYSNSNDGDVSGNHGDYDYWIVKLDSAGAITWQKSLGGTAYEFGNCISQTADGGYIVNGTSISNNGDVSGNHGGQDYWVVKLDSIGNLIWQKSLGGINNEYGTTVYQTMDSGYFITGDSQSNNGDVSGNHGSSDSWILKLDTAGNIMWQKCLGGTGGEGTGNYNLQTPDSGYIRVGQSNSNDGDVTGNHGGHDIWVVKLSPDGTTGVSDAANAAQLSVYPNPLSNELYIKTNNNSPSQVILYDIASRKLLEQTFTNSITLNTEQLANGIYIYEVSNKEAVIKKGKVVKE